MTEPVRMAVAVNGDPRGEALVVALTNGGHGWAGPPEIDGGSHVVLTVGERRVEGRARLVRSGAAYEEVCGRIRLTAGWRGRWTRRPDVVVVVAPRT